MKDSKSIPERTIDQCGAEKEPLPPTSEPTWVAEFRQGGKLVDAITGSKDWVLREVPIRSALHATTGNLDVKVFPRDEPNGPSRVATYLAPKAGRA